MEIEVTTSRGTGKGTYHVRVNRRATNLVVEKCSEGKDWDVYQGEEYLFTSELKQEALDVIRMLCQIGADVQDSVLAR